MVKDMKRPWGIKLATAMLLLEAIVGIVGILILIFFGMIIPDPVSQLQIYSDFIDDDSSAILSFLISIGAIILLIPTLISLILAKFLWAGNKFAWGLVVLFTAFSIVSNLVTFNLFACAFGILILLGLFHTDTLTFINLNSRFKGWKSE